MLSVSVLSLGFPILDRDNQVIANKGENVLTIGLRPLEGEEKTYANIRESLELLAQYIEMNGINTPTIATITYEKLARASRRWGFRISNSELPQANVVLVAREYAGYRKRGFSNAGLGKTLIVYQDAADFIDRYGSQSTFTGRKVE